MICVDEISLKHAQNSKRHISLIFLLSGIMLLFAIYAMGTGSSVNLGLWTTLSIIFGFEEGTSTQTAIIWDLRFPRVLMAIVGGAALATAGALMQGVLGNPLVSPLTLGVASGAALGAALAIVVGWSISDNPEFAIVLNAFLFSLLVVFIIIQLGNVRSVSAESYILVGIAITFISGAIVSTLTYFASDAQLTQLAHWSFGSLSRPDMGNAVFVSMALVVLMPNALKWSWDLNALAMGGDEFAMSSGVDPVRTRKNILVLSALMTSIVIAFTGLIGFVGLAAPHMSRILVGNDFRKLIPCSAVMGGLLMLFADTVGRTLFAPVVIPVGIMLSVIGGPFFMYLLLRRPGGR